MSIPRHEVQKVTVGITPATLTAVILTVANGFASLGNVFPTVRVTTPRSTAVTLTVAFLPEERNQKGSSRFSLQSTLSVQSVHRVCETASRQANAPTRPALAGEAVLTVKVKRPMLYL